MKITTDISEYQIRYFRGHKKKENLKINDMTTFTLSSGRRRTQKVDRHDTGRRSISVCYYTFLVMDKDTNFEDKFVSRSVFNGTDDKRFLGPDPRCGL